MLNDNRFYVYGLFDRDVPFYVGKGQGDRVNDHVKLAKRGSNYPVHKKIRSMGVLPDVKIILDKVNEDDAFDFEELAISTIGRRCLGNGPLLNLRDGGEGGSHSEESKKKMAKTRTGVKLTNEHKANIGTAHRGSKRSQETKKRMSVAQKGHHVSASQRANISATLMGRKLSKETVEKMSASRRGVKRPKWAMEPARLSRIGSKHTDEAKAKISAAGKGRKHTPEAKAKISAAVKGRKLMIVTCPHCAKSGAKHLMIRWHFENCKFKTGN